MLSSFTSKASTQLITVCYDYIENKQQHKLIQLQKTISFVYIVIINITKESDLITIFTYNKNILINTLKKILLIFKDMREQYISELVLCLCFNEYKRKILKYKSERLNKIFDFIFSELFYNYIESVPVFIVTKSFDMFINDLYTMQLDVNALMKINNECRFDLLNNIMQGIIVLMFRYEKTTKSKIDLIGFLSNIISTHITSTIKQYGTDYMLLFRKEDFSNLMIKYIYLSFGGNFFINAFYNNIQPYIHIFEKDFNSKETSSYPIQAFTQFFNEFIESMYNETPFVIKVILKLIHIEIHKRYSNVSDNNYAPVVCSLIINFFISPKVQDAYNLSVVKYKSMRIVNRLIRNICFNTKFEEDDKCKAFNTVIDTLCKKYYTYIQNEIINCIDIGNKEEINIQLTKVMCVKKGFKVPKFVYAFNWKLIATVFKLDSEIIECFNEDYG